MRGKERLVARVSAAAGGTRLLEALPGRPALLVLNYHRIGDARRAAHDAGVYSCTAAEFDRQLGHLKRRFTIVSLERALAVLAGEAPPSRPSILLTFDDGYRDNYETAFPLLRAHGATAAFFLTTGFVGASAAPWWDAVAAIVKGSPRTRVTLDYPAAAEFDLPAGDRGAAVEAVQDHFKAGADHDPERFLSALEAACGCKRPEPGRRLFLSWDEAREMRDGGMSFGSHTRTHPILAKLSYARQLEELRQSRSVLEAELQRPAACLAYPDGQPGTYSADTQKAAAEAGYLAAFSYIPGANLPGKSYPFDLRRYSDDSVDYDTWRLRVALRAAARPGLG